jgi:hypothetical protein
MRSIHPAQSAPLPAGRFAQAILMVALIHSLPAAASAGQRTAAARRIQTSHQVVAQPAAPALDAHAAAPCDQVWLISAREVCSCCCGRPPRIHIWRHAGCCWRAASLEEFLASDAPGVPTCFWIHGWRVSHCDAQQIGWSAYRRVKSQACGPFRFVIWSWPSQQTEGLLADARQKAHLSDVGAYPLAWVVDQIDPRVPVSMVGFSLGARIATGSLHLLGGGCLVGCRLAQRVHPERCPCRAVLLAGALDNFSLAAGQRNGQALCQTDRMLVMVNDSDMVLNWYPLLCGLSGPEAIGYTGSIGNLGPCHAAYAQMCVSSAVGSQHDWVPYFTSCYVLAAIADTALFADRRAGAVPTTARQDPRRQRVPRRASAK